MLQRHHGWLVEIFAADFKGSLTGTQLIPDDAFTSFL
jgi:hypothetical protein